MVSQPFVYLGCFGDTYVRAVNAPMINGQTITTCAERAVGDGAILFAIEIQHECFVGMNAMGYGRYGRTELCEAGGGGHSRISAYMFEKS